MKLLSVLIAVVVVSSTLAQGKPDSMPNDFDTNDVVICNGASGSATWSCKNAKTGEIQKVRCKVPKKVAQKMPKEMAFSELTKVCSLRSENRF
jgi:hypothetical protein